jgi:hypothetical protein
MNGKGSLIVLWEAVCELWDACDDVRAAPLIEALSHPINGFSHVSMLATVAVFDDCINGMHFLWNQQNSASPNHHLDLGH